MTEPTRPTPAAGNPPRPSAARTHSLDPCPVRFGAAEWGVVLFGVAIRVWLMATGRAPLDGDEGMMGIMALHLGRLREIPLYFYGQHYMGTLEIPPLAALMLFGSDAWKFSMWPIRLVETGYFIALCAVHFHLVGRLFGRGVGRWAVFFLCVAPIYWMDYSIRLRHVTLMMLLGEATGLVLISIVGDWVRERRVRPARSIALGLLAGAAWWHYQLSLVYLLLLPLLVCAYPSHGLDWIRMANLRVKKPKSGRRPYSVAWGAAARLAAMGASVVVLAGLSLGWWADPSIGYPRLIAIFVGVFAVAAIGSWRAYRWEKAEMVLVVDPDIPRYAPLQRFAPTLLLGGFLLGYAPTLVYLARLDETFWVSRVQFDFIEFFPRLRNLLLLDAASMLNLVRLADGDQTDPTINGRTYVLAIVYALGAYALMRKFVAPSRPSERLGAGYFLALLLILTLLHVVNPRHTSWLSPRFLVPAFSVVSVALALAAEQISELARRGGGARARFGFVSATLILMAGSTALWGVYWLEAPREELLWPSGHRRKIVEVVEALDEHGVERVRIRYLGDAALFGYELQYASALGIRFNRGLMADRLEGHVDESRYGGRVYELVDLRFQGLGLEGAPPWSPVDLDPAEEALQFRIGPYLVLPAREIAVNSGQATTATLTTEPAKR